MLPMHGRGRREVHHAKHYVQSGMLAVEYQGESARTCFDRGRNHLDNLRTHNKTNALVMHMDEMHQGKKWKYKIKVLKSHKSAMERQISVGRKIYAFKGDLILNQKGEWGQNRSQG